MISEKYKKTHEAYCKLGKRYIENSESINLLKLPEFIGLLTKGGKVLDVGCAGGRDSKKFAAAGFDVTGIDIVDVFIEEAGKRVPKAKFLQIDLLDINFPENEFDAIWAQAVLLHIERKDIPDVLAKMFKILKRNGKIHVAVKEGRNQGWEADKLTAGYKRYFIYFSKKEMEKYLINAGFDIILSEFAADESGRENVKWIVIWAQKQVE